MATELQQLSRLSVTRSAFGHGMGDGVSRYFYGDEPGRPVTEEDVIDFLLGAIVEWALEGYVDEERPRGECSFSWWLDFHTEPSASCQIGKKSVVERFLWRREYADYAGLPHGTRFE